MRNDRPIGRYAALPAVGLAALAIGLAGCGGDDSSDASASMTTAEAPATTMAEEAPMSIVETAVDAGQFTTLVSLLEQTGLDATLAEGGPYTVFAPTDEAFAKVPKETLDRLASKPKQLEAVLLYHVVDGDVRAADVMELDSAETLNGAPVPIEVSGDRVRVGEAEVVQADVAASNGVIHVIDTVLIPS